MPEAFDHHFIREMYEQPDGLRQTLTQSGPMTDALAARLANQVNRVILVGCGDPHFIAYAAARAFEQFAGLPTKPVDGLEFVLYGRDTLSPRTLVVAVSQSGKTIQAVQAMHLAQTAGACTLAVTNSPASPVTEHAQDVLLTHCGPSVSFPTKTTTSALALLFRLIVAIGKVRGRLQIERASDLLGELDAIPAHIETTLDLESHMQALAHELSGRYHFSFIGTGASYTTALLGAAKLKETSHTRAEAHQLEEFAHVHLFAIQPGDPLFFIPSSDRASARARELAAYAMRYEAQCVAIVGEDKSEPWRAIGAEVIGVPEGEEAFNPLVQVVPLQLFAYHLALAKGQNPDRPARFDNAAHQRLVYSDLLEGWHETNTPS